MAKTEPGQKALAELLSAVEWDAAGEASTRYVGHLVFIADSFERAGTHLRATGIVTGGLSISAELMGASWVLASGVNSLLAAIHLVGARYPFQGKCLLRLAVENFAVAIAIWKDARNWDRFQNNELPYSVALKIAKNVLPSLGPMWGTLSNSVSHSHVVQLSAVISDDEDQPPAIGPTRNEATQQQADQTMEGAMVLFAYYDVMAELFALQATEAPRYWFLRRDADGNLQPVARQHDLWERLAEFRARWAGDEML